MLYKYTTKDISGNEIEFKTEVQYAGMVTCVRVCVLAHEIKSICYWVLHSEKFESKCYSLQ